MKTPRAILDEIDFVSNGGRLPPELGPSFSVLPKKFGRYEVVRELGKGAMGIVYLGRDPVIGRLVALKTIRAIGDDEAEQREFGERFLREAQAAGILSHPNIVTVHDVGEDPETHTSFIAMEYVEGKNLKQLVQEKTPYTFERIADIIGQVAEALDYAHRKGIVHRDVKPANIIITSEGAVKITDFGIAKIEQSNLTSTGQFLGTPNYMSPEQVTGDPVDGRSDLFSLGVCLYELLTKKKPFSGDNLTSISYKIVHESFTPPEVYDANIPPEFGPTLQKGLAKDPAGRFQRGNDFALSLYEFKARQEERQMLRDLGQMVAEAENLGGMSSVQVSPSFSPPATPMAPSSGPVALKAEPAAPLPGRASSSESGGLLAKGASPDRGALMAAELSPPHSTKEFGSDGDASGGFELGVAGNGPAPPPLAPPGEKAPVDVEFSAPDWTIDEVDVLKASAPAPKPSPPPPPVPKAEVAAPAAPEPENKEPDWWAEAVPQNAPESAPLKEAEIFPERAPEKTPEKIPEKVATPRPKTPTPPPSVLSDSGAGLTERLDLRAALGLDPRKDAFPSNEFTERIPTLAPGVSPAAPAPPPSRANVFDEPVDNNRPTEFIKDAAELARMGAPRPSTPPPSTPRPVTPRPPTPRPPAPSPSKPPPPPPNLRKAPEAPKPAASVRDSIKESKQSLRPETPASPQAATTIEKLAPLPESAANGKQGTPPPVSKEQRSSAGGALKRQVSPKFVLLILGGVAALALVIVGALVNQRSTIKPTVPVEDELVKETAERRQLMTDGEQALKEGKSEEALKNFRELVRRSPSSAPAREALARAEAQAAAQLEIANKAKQVEEHLAAAREASLVPDDAKAISEADLVLGIDPTNTEAQTLKDAALERLSKKTLAQQKKIKDEIAARKKVKPKPVATAAPVAVVAAAPKAPEPAGAPVPTPAVANVRIAFQSPISRGLLMIGLNDKIVFRKDFDFGKTVSGGLVDGNVSLRSGPGTLKVWLLATDRSFKPYKAFDLSVPGDSKVLRIDLDTAGNFSVGLR